MTQKPKSAPHTCRPVKRPPPVVDPCNSGRITNERIEHNLLILYNVLVGEIEDEMPGAHANTSEDLIAALENGYFAGDDELDDEGWRKEKPLVYRERIRRLAMAGSMRLEDHSPVALVKDLPLLDALQDIIERHKDFNWRITRLCHLEFE